MTAFHTITNKDMDKAAIAALARQMKTKEDLVALLNRIKQDEMSERGIGDKFRPSTTEHVLNLYCNPNNTYHRYKQFTIKKKSGGYRQITAPCNKSFMFILRHVNEIFKAVYTPSKYATGFAEGRSVVDNASRHKGMNYVFNIDLKDFFPSIEQARVWKRLQLEPLNFPQPIASVLAGLCSMRGEQKGDGTYKYVLPQGAPTSPIITNMICDTLDRRLADLAKRFGLNYSRYADDITFSSMHNVYGKNGEFTAELKRIITGQGFEMNESKTRLQKLGERQEVTGLIVSQKVNVSQKYVRDIRNLLYIWDRYGYTDAYAKFYPKYKAGKGLVKKGNPDIANVINGKLMYLKMVKGEDDSVYQRLHSKFTRLAATLSDPSKTTEHGITYIETMAVKDFEKKYSTKISFAVSTPKEISCRPNATEEERKDAQRQHLEKFVPRRYGTFILGEKKHLVSINKTITKADEQRKDLLSISRCRNSKGKLFWLLHKSNKITGPNPSPVNIDELNSDLDSLLKM